MINRLNYEIWFLDYSEGNLCNEDKDHLFSFLESNPDLKEEFESFQIFELEDEKSVFGNKHNLKKQITIDQIEGLDEFEILAIKKIEGEISGDEQEFLDHLVELSESRRQELKAFEQTKLVLIEKISFEAKESLKKKSGIMRMIFNYSSSIAAAVLLIIFFSSIIRFDEERSDNFVNSIVKNENSYPNSTLSSNDLIKPNIQQSDVSRNYQNYEDPEKLLYPGSNTGVKHEGKTDQSGLVLNNNYNRTDILPGARITTYLKELNKVFTALDKNPKPQYIDYSSGRNAEIAVNEIGSVVPALTPKEFFIKTIKNKLDIKDNDYSRLNTMDVVSAAVDKSKFASINYEKNDADDSKEFAFNIGSLSFSRKWSTE